MTTAQRPPITIRGDDLAITDLESPQGPMAVLTITAVGVAECMILLTNDGLTQLREQCDQRLKNRGARLAVASADEKAALGIRNGRAR